MARVSCHSWRHRGRWATANAMSLRRRRCLWMRRLSRSGGRSTRALRRVAGNAELAVIVDFAAKAAEQAARIAGVLTIVDGGLANEIEAGTMRGAVNSDWYVNEALRLQLGRRTDLKLVRAQRLLDWLRQHGGEVGLRKIYLWAHSRAQQGRGRGNVGDIATPRLGAGGFKAPLPRHDHFGVILNPDTASVTKCSKLQQPSMVL